MENGTKTYMAVRRYLADAGRTLTVAVGVVAAAGIAVELMRPGSVFAYLSPQAVVLLLTLGIALGSADSGASRRGWASVVAYWLTAAVAAWAAIRLASAHADAFTGAETAIPAVAGIVVIVVFFGCRAVVRRNGKGA